MPTTYAQLCEWMAAGKPVRVTDHNEGGWHGTINAIEREDGSGRCWNVTMTRNGNSFKFFIRTR